MRRRFVGTAFSVVLAVVGCDGAASPPPSPEGSATAGPHGGVAYALPERAGYAEVVNEPPVTDRATTPTSAVVYFLGPDAKSALSPAPTDVTLKVERGRKGSETLVLKAVPRSGDAAGASRFVSAPGPNDIEAMHCRVTAKLGGNPIDVPVSGAR